MVERICPTCKKVFTYSGGGNRKYCSEKCRKKKQIEKEKEKRKLEKHEDVHWMIDKTIANVCLNCTLPAKKCKGDCKEVLKQASAARYAEWRRQVNELYDLGLSDKQIADRMQISQCTVRNIRKELGLVAHRKKKKEVKASA